MLDKFFGSKLNTVLLLVLIVLMVFAIKMMFKNREIYLFPFNQKEEQLKTSEKLPEILGNKEDLIIFSVGPNSKVSGIVEYQGVIQGGYFFEANILVNILDMNKKVLKKDHANATSDWMTVGPVSFAGSVDFSELPKGHAYLSIEKDDPSDMPEVNAKSVLIPIIIE